MNDTGTSGDKKEATETERDDETIGDDSDDTLADIGGLLRMRTFFCLENTNRSPCVSDHRGKMFAFFAIEVFGVVAGKLRECFEHFAVVVGVGIRKIVKPGICECLIPNSAGFLPGSPTNPHRREVEGVTRN